jgi:hypothetical protein
MLPLCLMCIEVDNIYLGSLQRRPWDRLCQVSVAWSGVLHVVLMSSYILFDVSKVLYFFSVFQYLSTECNL